ncbi:MAG TPA: T9SS type A sorting domain-containing protein [Bacteroidales bacterium]|nr:T9SS type A sorting domain-containing protein [Bacteroidales bacterium]
MRKLVLLLIFALPSVLHAQYAITSVGGNSEGAGGYTSFSVGQVAYTYISSETGSVSMGVQQPYEIWETGISEFDNVNLSIATFPNPTSDYLILKIGDKENLNIDYQLFDINGKMLYNGVVIEGETKIDMKLLDPGTYVLNLVTLNQSLKTFTIIKH